MRQIDMVMKKILVIGSLNIDTMVTDGLEGIKLDDQIIIISGMGAHSIVGILKNNQAKLKK